MVAFPVTVLIINFSSEQGRDYTAMIQAIGMSAAAFLLLFSRPEDLHLPLILVFCVIGTPGAIFGLWLQLPSYSVNVVYTVLILQFAILLFYSKAVAPALFKTPETVTIALPPSDEIRAVGRRRVLALGLAVPVAFVGGICSASVGVGSDMLLYAYGLYGWNLLVPEEARTDVSHTASCVVVMALLSIVTATVRITTVGMDAVVYDCWGATAWVVVLGAPLGSLLLTPLRATFLRTIFYVLVVLQTVSFSLLKIKNDLNVWLATSALTLSNVSLLAAHWVHNPHCCERLPVLKSELL